MANVRLWPTAHRTPVPVDAPPLPPYHGRGIALGMEIDGGMADLINNPEPSDPLLIGELITLQEAAEYSGLSKESIHNYVKRGRLKARKRGWMWFTTRAAVDDYLQSRQTEHIPKKYRKED